MKRRRYLSAGAEPLPGRERTAFETEKLFTGILEDLNASGEIEDYIPVLLGAAAAPSSRRDIRLARGHVGARRICFQDGHGIARSARRAVRRCPLREDSRSCGSLPTGGAAGLPRAVQTYRTRFDPERWSGVGRR